LSLDVESREGSRARRNLPDESDMLARDGGRRKSESRKRVPPGKVVIIVEGILRQKSCWSFPFE
jgi:hypothetical protein